MGYKRPLYTITEDEAIEKGDEEVLRDLRMTSRKQSRTSRRQASESRRVSLHLEVEKAKEMGYKRQPRTNTEDEAVEKDEEEVSKDLHMPPRKRSRIFWRQASEPRRVCGGCLVIGS
jgi:hypothetical protein